MPALLNKATLPKAREDAVHKECFSFAVFSVPQSV